MATCCASPYRWAERLKAAREAMTLTLEALGELWGVDPEELGAMERGVIEVPFWMYRGVIELEADAERAPAGAVAAALAALPDPALREISARLVRSASVRLRRIEARRSRTVRLAVES